MYYNILITGAKDFHIKETVYIKMNIEVSHKCISSTSSKTGKCTEWTEQWNPKNQMFLSIWINYSMLQYGSICAVSIYIYTAWY
jgi:hypothetical protein